VNKEIISKLIAIVNEKENVHYIELAWRLMVSPSTAQRYAALFSQMFSNYVEYRRGVIHRKQIIGLENLDDGTRVKALQHTLDTLNRKIEDIKRELKRIISDDFDKKTKKEIKEKIESLLEWI